MRLWSIHPKYLDSKGLVALWREALLAQKVLHNETNGYRNHPQLIRFKSAENPIGLLVQYLEEIHNESLKRGYKFDRSKILGQRSIFKIEVTSGQIRYEMNHLLHKLKNRDRSKYKKIKTVVSPDPNPIFKIVDGDIEQWEIIHT
ncbi:pyrimidine dimer DNA glycosylase/endonuclease V [Candidatus Latescibacterota bacterium]